MSAHKDERKKVPLNIETYNTLKDFSRYNGLKLRIVLDAMTDVMLANEEINKRVVELAIVKSAQSEEPAID